VHALTAIGLGRVAARLPVGYKILLPFLALTLASGLTFATVAALELATGATAQADALLVRQGDATAERMASFGDSQQVALRLLSGAPGLAEAVEAGDRQAIQAVLLPMLGSQSLSGLRVSVIATDGTEVLTLRSDPADPQGCICTYGRRLAAWSDTTGATSGTGVADDVDGAVAYTIGPLRGAHGLVGALMATQPVKALASDLGRTGDPEVALYFADGSLLAASPGFPPGHNLDAGQRARVMAGHSVRPASATWEQMEVLVLPWTLHGHQVGYMGLAVPPIGVGFPDRLALLLAVTFFAAVAFCLLGGVFVSRAISRPLSRLVEAAREVADGKVSFRKAVEGEDEIGRLAASFNHMVGTLKENRVTLERTMNNTLETLAAAIDARDPYTHGHSQRVADYAVALGAVLGLDSSALGLLHRACLVHDIGKIGVPDRVLLKVGPLSREERQVIEAHPVIGFRVLSHLAWEPEVLDVVRHHHERWDGEGYPDGLAGNRVPLLARVAGLADALDAMVSERVYRARLDWDGALAEIKAGRGSQFDPAVVRGFLAAEATMRDLVNGTHVRMQVVAV
jgi:putative nucleotidyltransferase with HDIG domain